MMWTSTMMLQKYDINNEFFKHKMLNNNKFSQNHFFKRNADQIRARVCDVAGYVAGHRLAYVHRSLA
jgi:hypothetical protein